MGGRGRAAVRFCRISRARGVSGAAAGARLSWLMRARQHLMIQQPIYADRVYQFLAELLPRTRRHGDAKITQRLEHAMLHYTPPVTSEFLGVSMTALQEMLTNSSSIFSPSELKRAKELVSAIKQWFS